VQTALNNAGFTLQEDGFMGKKTKEALKKFQKENGLKVTGKADKATLAKLGIQ
jgi:peptidoglycan hydrolase-like protein with peptidoglycan-binding domain